MGKILCKPCKPKKQTKTAPGNKGRKSYGEMNPKDGSEIPSNQGKAVLGARSKCPARGIERPKAVKETEQDEMPDAKSRIRGNKSGEVKIDSLIDHIKLITSKLRQEEEPQRVTSPELSKKNSGGSSVSDISSSSCSSESTPRGVTGRSIVDISRYERRIKHLNSIGESINNLSNSKKSVGVRLKPMCSLSFNRYFSPMVVRGQAATFQTYRRPKFSSIRQLRSDKNGHVRLENRVFTQFMSNSGSPNEVLKKRRLAVMRRDT